jgi:hypothetical protein
MSQSNLQMDAASAVARAANLAKYGDSNKKEARGMQLLSCAIREDGRLEYHKSFEGARADCCVYRPGAPALGIQLKTTGVTEAQTPTGNEYYRFRQTDGYSGLLIVFVALHVQPSRIWIADGSRVVSTNVAIPAKFRRGMRSDRVLEVDLATVADAIYTIYVATLSGSSNYVLRSPTDHEKPTARTTLSGYSVCCRCCS